MSVPPTVTYEGQKWHELQIDQVGKLTLPVIRLNPSTYIASFVLIDNYDLVKKLAVVLGEAIAKYDPQYVLCIEAKSIALAYAICDRLNTLNHLGRGENVRYVVVRKSRKVYMKSPYRVTMKSITTKDRQMLFLDRVDATRLRSGRFVLIDDVISTGSTINALLKLLNRLGLTPAAIFTVLFEGKTGTDEINYVHKDRIYYFGRIPLYVKK